MVGNVDLESDNQAGLAQEVLEAMLLGAPTTTPDIPTRTRDPDLTQGIICCVLTIFFFQKGPQSDSRQFGKIFRAFPIHTSF